MNKSVAKHIVVKGRVQGVGFRYNTVQEAKRHGLTGWVRNRNDGTVEIYAQGGADAMKPFLEWCRQGPAFADVTALAITNADIDPTLNRFEQKRSAQA